MSLFSCQSRNFHQPQINYKKKKYSPKPGYEKGSLERETYGFWSHTLCRHSLPALWNLRCLVLLPPHPQPRGGSAEVMWWEALPSSTEANSSFLSISQKIFSPFHACPQISLTIHILDRKHMLTISKIDHCGINYRNVETSMQAFWSSRLFLCNVECVIKHHFP